MKRLLERLINLAVLFLLLLILIGCEGKVKNNDEAYKNIDTNDIKNEKSIILDSVKNISLLGNFDGDLINDTLFVKYYNKNNNDIVYEVPTNENCWDSVIAWYFQNQVVLFLTMNHNDTIYYGSVNGIFSLINLGDINNDKRDEIAIVVDRLDFSNLNSCSVYSYCSKKWEVVKWFKINESIYCDNLMQNSINQAFILNYLEQKDGIWFYTDYYTYMETNEFLIEKLIVDACY